MELLIVLIVCAVLLAVVRTSRDRSFGIFTYRNGTRSPGDDHLGRARGIQEEDLDQPWRPPPDDPGRGEPHG